MTVGTERHPLVEELINLEPLKTWSLLVTVLGDLESGKVTGARLRDLLTPIGIRPEAIRVALYRLKADGWIVSQKTGREAVYALSPNARSETEAVRSDVYERLEKFPEGWQIHLLENGQSTASGVPIGQNAFALPNALSTAVTESMALCFDGSTLPSWVEEALVPPAMLRNAQELARLIPSSHEHSPRLGDSDCVSMRILVLHHWRRLALRQGTWAHMGLLPEGAIAQCRYAVTEFLDNTNPISSH